MPKTNRLTKSDVPRNNTVKLTDGLRERIDRAMAAQGFTVWSEFCRVALTEKCLASERQQGQVDVPPPPPRTDRQEPI